MAHGPGSYGVMGTKTKFGTGHETVWEVDDNNQVWVYDGQASRTKRTFEQYKNDVGVEPWDVGTSVYNLTNATPNIAHQAEDHAFYPSFDLPNANYRTEWDRAGRNYTGPSSEDTTYSERRRMYGI